MLRCQEILVGIAKLDSADLTTDVKDMGRGTIGSELEKKLQRKGLPKLFRFGCFAQIRSGLDVLVGGNAGLRQFCKQQTLRNTPIFLLLASTLYAQRGKKWRLVSGKINKPRFSCCGVINTGVREFGIRPLAWYCG